MSNLRPLSELTERLQTISKSKHGDSYATGSEFRDEYGIAGQPLDEQPNKDIALAGGDVGNAYSKVYSVYMMAKNANANAKNEFKKKGKDEQSLNTQVLVGNLEYAVEHLANAEEKLSRHDVPVADELAEIREQLDAHRERIDETGMVVVE